MLNIQSCIIIGAGISGLTVAYKLREYEIDVTLIDKGQAPGGRMARRIIDDAIYDHGAQFITTREKVFRDRVEDWKDLGVVKPWYTGPLGNMRYVGSDGMSAIPVFLARDLQVHLSEKVVGLHFKDNLWTVDTEPADGRRKHRHSADFLVITAPVPQALRLVRASNIEIDYDEEDELEKISYLKCISYMVRLKGPAGLPNPGAVDLNHDLIRFIGDNSVKGISPQPGTITIHSSPRFAEVFWDRPDAERVPPILNAARPFLKSDVVSASVHRWRYSEPIRIYKEKQPFRVPFFLDERHRLAMCGDGFNGPRIEAAAMSGLALGERLVRPI
jgi:hypothetical protein